MNTWQSFNAYFHNLELADRFIHDVCISFERESCISSYFFVRLLEESPVIKFRVKTEKKNEVTSIMKKKIKKYNTKNINKEEYFKYFRPDLDSTLWIPHGTIQESNYYPEYERYGGPLVLSLVEELFCLSSRIIGKSFNRYLDWKQRLNVSYQLNTALFDQVNINQQDKKKYFEFLGDTWLDYARGTLKNINKEYLVGVAARTLENRERIEIFDNNLINLELFQNYQTLINEIKSALLLNKPILLSTPHHTSDLSYLLSSLDDQFTPKLFISIAHMNNNRLGIFPHSESTMYYLHALLQGTEVKG